MANKRKPTKKQCGGYLDEVIINALADAPYGKTQFFEECVIRGLLKRRQLKKSQIIALHAQKCLHHVTFENLRADKLV